jgi:hypothetical protein
MAESIRIGSMSPPAAGTSNGCQDHAVLPYASSAVILRTATAIFSFISLKCTFRGGRRPVTVPLLELLEYVPSSRRSEGACRMHGSIFAKLLPGRLHFFTLHFLFDLDFEPTQIGQLPCFLFGGLARSALQDDAARAVAGKNGIGHFRILYFLILYFSRLQAGKQNVAGSLPSACGIATFSLFGPVRRSAPMH